MSDLPDYLACPRCDNSLDGLRCAACRVDYPLIDGVAWLFADPDSALGDWRNRWNLALTRLEQQADTCAESLRRTQSAAGRRRLSGLEAGYRQQRGALRTLLAPLGLGDVAEQSTYLALKTRLPTQVGLLSYENNVFRDWVWGSLENESSLAAVMSVLAEPHPRNTLILGSGSGRLACDLHAALDSRFTVALDVNPYLTTINRKMADGESLELTEFPLAPSVGHRSAITRSLQGPEKAGPGFCVVLADALRPPFQAGSFDLVVTPWLLDVINAPPAALLGRINALLAPNGRWIHHGSLAFNQADPADCPNLDELLELAESSGFANMEIREDVVPYLDCPDSRHGRRESVVTFCADKVADAPPAVRHQNLPDWIANGREPIPLLPAFQMMAMTTRMHAFIMTLIDGKRSLRDLALVMDEQQLMTKADAESAIRGFLIKMYEDSENGGL
jgi:SAM-dependent methyltransferase